MTTSTISLIAQLQDGSSRPATSDEIIAAARDHMSRRVRRGTHLSSPKATRDYLSLKLGSLEREVFAVIFLDKRHRLISYQEMFQGTIDGASVHPREVVKEALKQNAAAVILAHPHPSGVAEPSAADEAITQRLREALNLIDVRVLDHILGGFEVVLRSTELKEKQAYFPRRSRITWTLARAVTVLDKQATPDFATFGREKGS
jgi:DNA repair protein RadC